MRKQRKLRRLKIDVTKFLAEYNDAHACDMTVRDFCAVTGLHISTLHGRLRTLAKRGVILPMLKGMRKRTQLGKMLGACPSPAVADEAVQVPATPVEVPVALDSPSFQICVGSGF